MLIPACTVFIFVILRTGVHDPTSTYARRGSGRVLIVSNSESDEKRFMTLQVLVRGIPYREGRPRGGQPKLGIIFRGTGIRITDAERDLYHPDVIVRFQPKAWADRAYSAAWAEEDWTDYILNSGECNVRENYLLFHDNLDSQTTPEFRAALQRNGVKGYSHALLAGNTDGLQPVDGGVGALLKHEQEEVFDEWLENDDNWNEWSGARIPASRKRGLLTQFYGVAWERVCRSFPFPKVSVC